MQSCDPIKEIERKQTVSMQKTQPSLANHSQNIIEQIQNQQRNQQENKVKFSQENDEPALKNKTNQS